jgi:hypothetical protein
MHYYPVASSGENIKFLILRTLRTLQEHYNRTLSPLPKVRRVRIVRKVLVFGKFGKFAIKLSKGQKVIFRPFIHNFTIFMADAVIKVYNRRNRTIELYPSRSTPLQKNWLRWGATKMEDTAVPKWKIQRYRFGTTLHTAYRTL